MIGLKEMVTKCAKVYMAQAVSIVSSCVGFFFYFGGVVSWFIVSRLCIIIMIPY